MPRVAAGVFLYVETALHIGAGEPGRAIDLPLQRDEDGVPLVPESPLRGSLLAAVRRRCGKGQVVWAFGSPPGSEKPQVGVLSFSPMRPLLFPVRTYKGVLAWITCTSAVGAWLPIAVVPQHAEGRTGPRQPGAPRATSVGGVDRVAGTTVQSPHTLSRAWQGAAGRRGTAVPVRRRVLAPRDDRRAGRCHVSAGSARPPQQAHPVQERDPAPLPSDVGTGCRRLRQRRARGRDLPAADQ